VDDLNESGDPQTCSVFLCVDIAIPDAQVYPVSVMGRFLNALV